MIDLVDTIDTIYAEEFDEYKGGLSPRGVREIKELLVYDRLLQSVKPSEYDGVIVTHSRNPMELEINFRFAGEVFFSKDNRFKDGQCIITTNVVDIEKARHEIYVVETENSVYLVIKR